MKNIVAFFLLLYSCSVIANEVYELPPVIVTGTKIPKKYTIYNITVITSSMLKEAKFTTIQEALNYYLDVKQRSIAQQDLSIRGSTFEQVLILIDGMPIRDSQTAHHNMDIPVNLSDIERIEILKGGASSIYGSAAFSGVVNIITKKEVNKYLRVTSGENNTIHANISIPLKVNNNIFSISTSYKKSDGFYYNTDYEISNLSIRSKLNNSYLINFGYLDKSFGAANFYCNCPESHETTKTTLLTLTKKLKDNSEVKFYYRRHYDKYVYIKDKPRLYTNYHKKYSYGFNVHKSIYLSEVAKVAVGIDAEKDRIRSTGIRRGKLVTFLGFHTKGKLAPYIETEYIKDNFILTGSLRYDNLYQLTPTIAALYKLKAITYRMKYSKAFRRPSYTELYYEDPRNIGNPNLKEERANEYELGIDYNNNFKLTLFRSKGYNLIDWVKKENEDKWRAKNISEIDFSGIEATLDIKSFQLNYTFITTNKKEPTGYISKYVLTHPRHRLSLSYNSNLGRIYNHIRLTYKKRVNQDKGYFVVNSTHSIKFKNKEFFVKLNNIGNKKYYEIINIYMPPRYIESGVEIEW